MRYKKNNQIIIYDDNIFTDRNHDSFIVQQDKNSCIKLEITEHTEYGIIIDTLPKDQNSIFSKIELPNFISLQDSLHSLEWSTVYLSLIAFILVSFHALTPRHGKSLIATYLVGQRGKIQDAILLGLTTTVTHTSTIFLLGISTIIATKFISLGSSTNILEIISATILTLFGLHLVGKRARKMKSEVENPHNHTHDHDYQLHKINFKSILTMGVSSGLTPCAEALAILILAINLNKLTEGLILLLAFSFGLTLTIILISIASLKLKDFLNKSTLFDKISTYLPLFSTIVITLVGLTLLFQI